MRQQITTARIFGLASLTLLLACGWLQAFAAGDYGNAYTAYQQQEFAEAEKIWQDLANSGDANAQYALAVMHLKGECAKPNPEVAFRLLQDAANQGHVTAMFNLGIAFWEGTGTEADKQQALEWWHKAADQGEAGAQYNLGLAYYIGEQQPQNLEQATHWLSSAAAANHPEAEKLMRLIQQETNPDSAVSDQSASTGVETMISIQAPPPSMERAPLEVEIVEQPAVSVSEQQPASAVEPEPLQQYWQTSAKASLYPTPALLEPVLANLPEKTPVEVLEQQDGKTRITIPGGIPLWIYGKYVSADGERGVVDATSVNARPLPDTDNLNSPPVGRFTQGDQVGILEIRGEWIRVRAPAHLGAWLDSSFLTQYADTPINRKSTWESAIEMLF